MTSITLTLDIGYEICRCYGFDDEIPFHAGTLHVVPAASAGDRPGRRGGGRRGAVHHQVVRQHGGNQGEKYLDGLSTE